MSLTSILLLLLAAVTHAGWNFISKKEQPTLAFYLVANSIGVGLVLPFLFIFRAKMILIPPIIWVFAGMSGFFLASYLAALAGAYRAGDISIAYPLARSLPVIFILMVTLILGQGEGLGWMLLGGIFFVVVGCLILPMRRLQEFHFKNYLNPCCGLAVLAAIGISGYTIVDDTALRHLRGMPNSPFHPIEATVVYLILEGVCCSLWQGILVGFSRRERQGITKVIRDFKAAALTTGIGIYLTYGLVLASMNYVTNVNYVSAFRQLSIPIGALMGIFLLKEPGYVPKIIGVAAIFVGVVLVGFG